MHYSKQIVDIIKSLLILDPEQRPNLTMIKSLLTEDLSLSPPKFNPNLNNLNPSSRRNSKSKNSLKSDLFEVQNLLNGIYNK